MNWLALSDVCTVPSGWLDILGWIDWYYCYMNTWL